MNKKKNTLGEYLKELRENSNFTINDVKNRTRISKSSISDWENNKRIPSEYNLNLLANFYDVDIAQLTIRIHADVAKVPIYDRSHIKFVNDTLGHNQEYFVFDSPLLDPNQSSDYFFTKKEDASLDQLGILPGSQVIAKRTNALENGDIGIFIVNNIAIMREYQKVDDHTAYLIPHSNKKGKYRKMKVNLDQLNIVARVEIVINDFTNKN